MYSIYDSKSTNEQLRQYYSNAKTGLNSAMCEDLDVIFEVALKHRLFPRTRLVAETPQAYFDRWIEQYVRAVTNLPSARYATPRRVCTDPAIREIVKRTQRMSEEEAINGEIHHNLFMSAENVQGNLLEEYINTEIRPYGFLWCCGNMLHAVDFCSADGDCLLQIKNKSNTENSSSSTVREGTEIKKWYRLSTVKKEGKLLPKYRWDVLNRIIADNTPKDISLPPCEMSEDKYQTFLSQCASNNDRLITSK